AGVGAGAAVAHRAALASADDIRIEGHAGAAAAAALARGAAAAAGLAVRAAVAGGLAVDEPAAAVAGHAAGVGAGDRRVQRGASGRLALVAAVVADRVRPGAAAVHGGAVIHPRAAVARGAADLGAAGRLGADGIAAGRAADVRLVQAAGRARRTGAADHGGVA